MITTQLSGDLERQSQPQRPLSELRGKKGMSCKLAGALGMALLFSLVEIFLAATPAFIWVYKWWGALPVFITTYIPFFLASNFVPDAGEKFQKVFLGGLIGLNILLLAILVPLGVI